MMKNLIFFGIFGIINLPLLALGEVSDCPKECLNVVGRMEQEQCASKVLRGAEDELQKYIAIYKKANKDTPNFDKSIDLAQSDWLSFRKATCSAVTETWTTGTGRSLATYACEIDLTRRWTHLIWEYFSSKKDKLPEPKE